MVSGEADLALVAQWIEHRPPEAGAQVRLLSGARWGDIKAPS